MSITNILLKTSKKKVFFFSYFIIVVFYFFEIKILGIDPYYHPDSIYYITENVDSFFHTLFNKPRLLFSIGYLHISHLLNQNYFFLIFLNFTLYSLSNLIIFNIVFYQKKKNYSHLKMFLLFIILFLDPYRLHLSCHVLKEPILIFILLLFLNYKSKLKYLLILMLAFIRKDAYIYLITLIKFSDIKEFLFNSYNLFKNLRNWMKFCLLTFIFLLGILIINIIPFIYFHLTSELYGWHFREMGGREFDVISNFQNYDIFIFKNVILKTISWSILILSGIYFILIPSLLFKILGLFTLFCHVICYYICKKSFISIGLILVIISISLYSSSFTAMFRYSYIAIFLSIINFFKINNEKILIK